MGDAEAAAGIENGGVQTLAGFDGEHQQIERGGKAAAKTIDTAMRQPFKDTIGQHVAEADATGEGKQGRDDAVLIGQRAPNCGDAEQQRRSALDSDKNRNGRRPAITSGDQILTNLDPREARRRAWLRR